MEYVTFLSGINFAHPTWDIFLLGILILVSFFYGFSVGQGRLLLSLFSLYLAYLITTLISFKPIVSELKSMEMFALEAAFFATLGVILFLLLSRSLAASYLKFKREADRIVETFALSFSEVGLALAILASFMPEKLAADLAPFTTFIFLGGNALLLWMIFPLLIIFWIGKKGR